jgi:tetratricopeptide (TPR) repeat protein
VLKIARFTIAAIGVTALALIGCGRDVGHATADRDDKPARVGREPIVNVHLHENHSSALIEWSRHGVRSRIVVHLDGHADYDWLPDETIARLATASPAELINHEVHPYAMDGGALSGFAIWNFIYPAARLGLVREFVWVVPDGTLADNATVGRFVGTMLFEKLQMLQPPEARSLSWDGALLRGEILGLPVTICELRNLPEIDEPVLLDIDLDYFSTRSALTLYVTDRPWIRPREVLGVLEQKGIATDLVTLSLSTIGGFLPPSDRWIGDELRRLLRDPAASESPLEAERFRIGELVARGELDRAVEGWRALVESHPDDPTLWFALAETLEAAGEPEQAEEPRRRAARLDPLLRLGDLLLADRLWLNGGWAAALARYERYLERLPDGPHTAYAMRRQAGCLARLRRPTRALEVYAEVVRRAPEHADTRMDYGMLLRDEGRLEEAIEQLRAARRILPDRANYARALGTSLLLAGRIEEGIPELEQAVRRQPCVAGSRGNLSAALLERGRYQEAAGHLRHALAFQPQNPRFRAIATELSLRGFAVAPETTPMAGAARSRNVRNP